MNTKTLSFFSLLFVSSFIVTCSTTDNFVVLHQISGGPAKTNCYLLYDKRSNDAAFFDVAGPIDSLNSVIIENNLNLKYIFITHAHPDHVQGLPHIMKKYPQAKLCLSKEEYEDMSLYADWESFTSPQEIAEVKKYPEILKMLNFDFQLIGEPDIYIKDDKIYKLGSLKIRTFISPGHSRGSVCYYVENVLFSGDVLFYRKVGSTDKPQAGGPEQMIKSVRRLYNLLPDETKVYPGHGQFTDIGTEKIENEEVTLTKVNIQN
jgi:glyoxylase-like metal-dependent hydrolase (beta-lactamase superfamily II)